MRRLMTVIAAIALVAAISSQARAVFTPGSSVTFPSTTTVGGVGTVSLVTEMRTINTGTGALGVLDTALRWTGITLPTKWRICNTAIVVHSTIGVPNGGIQIFTDNAAATASPKFIGRLTDVTPSTSALGVMLDTADVGDLAVDGETNANEVTLYEQTTSRVGLCWRAVDVSTNSLTIIQVDGDGNPLTPNDDALYSQEIGPFVDPITGQLFGQWSFMLDKGRMNDPLASPTDQNGGDFVTVKDGRGLHFFPGPDAFFGVVSPDIIYLGGNFEKAFASRTYKANLRMETFTE